MGQDPVDSVVNGALLLEDHPCQVKQHLVPFNLEESVDMKKLLKPLYVHVQSFGELINEVSQILEIF